tara:strand:- start:20028 stop:20651 length:624 start_codon:yes stop_codon:yes gene_type:complete
MEAQQWLKSAKDYEIGLEILKNAKVSPLIWRLLAKGKSFYNCQRLEKEISALIIPQKPKNTANVVSKIPVKNVELGKVNYPKALFPAYQQQRKLYAQVNHLHPLLDATYNLDRKKAFDIKLALQNAWQEIEEIWRLLNYWQENQVVLPNKYQAQGLEPELDKAQMLKRRNNLRTYLSKHQGNPKKNLACQEWRQELSKLDKILAHAL